MEDGDLVGERDGLLDGLSEGFKVGLEDGTLVVALDSDGAFVGE